MVIIGLIFLAGCQGMRLGVTQTQKQNAWVHHRTAQIIADVTAEQSVSEELKSVANLSELQSRAFMVDYGLPNQLADIDTLSDVLKTKPLALSAINDSSGQHDTWEIVDGAVDVGIGIAGLLGGVWGIRIAGFLVDARKKSNALREIVMGNELFKYQNQDSAIDFKKSHMNQSTVTRKIVSEVKNG